ncbi:MAG: polyketide synthase, partial [Gammaproteobacteria bacterium]|nr:polyketide synthase [Gammaproteobacteria bacterium]
IAGLTKIILQMKYGQIVPSLHSNTLNPNIAFEKTPFMVNQGLVPWRRPVIEGREVPRLAGISSFGAGGANAHVVLEEYSAKDCETHSVIEIQTKDPVIIVLSARTKDQLEQRAGDLLQFLHSSKPLSVTSRNKDKKGQSEINAKLKEKIKEILADLLHVEKEALYSGQSFSDYGVERIHLAKLFETICEEYEFELDLDEWIKQDSIEALLQYCLGKEKESHGQSVATIPAVDLQSMAYTLQTGREAMGERLGFIVTSIQELEEKLESYISGCREIDDFYQGEVKCNRDTLAVFEADEDLQQAIESWINKGKYSNILDLWVKGLVFDWNKFYGESKPKRISLPTYPFARERYWISEVQDKGIIPKSGSSVSVIHPLLHENTSDLSEQRFTSTFTGKDFFLNDHKVKGEKVLPGVCYLEMARAAVEKASGEMEKGTTICLRNVVWTQLIVVNDFPRKVHIGLQGEDNGQIQFEVYTESDNEEGAIVHFQGIAEFKEKEKTSILDIQNLRSQMNHGTLSTENCYRAFKEMGIDYGEGHRGIREIYQGENHVLVKLRLPSSVQDTQNDYVLHPSLMDAA